MLDVRAKARKNPEARCSYCHGSDELLSECHRCKARIHLECFVENSERCPTIGCNSIPGEAMPAWEPDNRSFRINERRQMEIRLGDFYRRVEEYESLIIAVIIGVALGLVTVAYAAHTM